MSTKYATRTCLVIPPNAFPTWANLYIQTGFEDEALRNNYRVADMEKCDFLLKESAVGKLYYSPNPSATDLRNPLGTALHGKATVRGHCYLLSNYVKGKPSEINKEVWEALKKQYAGLTGGSIGTKRTLDDKMPNKSKSAFNFYSAEHIATRKKQLTETKQPVDSAELKQQAEAAWDALSMDDRAVYYQKEKDDKLRYDAALLEYNRTNPKAPKQPRSAYHIYCKQTGRAPGKRKSTDETAPVWTKLGAEEKKKFEDLAVLDKTRFETEYTLYAERCTAVGRTPEPREIQRKAKQGDRRIQELESLLEKQNIPIPPLVAAKRQKVERSKKTEDSKQVSAAAEKPMDESDSSSEESDA